MIDQCTYLEKILQRFNLINAQVAPTPLPQDYHPMAHEGVIDPKIRSLFQQVIRSLLYFMLGTCPNIVYIVIALSKHATKPSKEHLDRAFYICHYLLRTHYFSPVFDGFPKADLIAYTNSNWASDLNTWHLKTGWFIKLAGFIFSWQSHQQSHVALSNCSKQVVWICTILEELGYDLQSILICGDNQGSIFMADNSVTESCSKHIDLRWHGTHNYIKESLIKIFYIKDTKSPTDVFTKNLG